MIFSKYFYKQDELSQMETYLLKHGNILGKQKARRHFLKHNFDTESLNECLNIIKELPNDTDSLPYKLAFNYMHSLMKKILKWDMSNGEATFIFKNIKRNPLLFEEGRLKEFLLQLPKDIEVKRYFEQ